MKKRNQIIRNLLNVMVVILVISYPANAQTTSKWNAPAWADTLYNPYAHNAAITDTGKVLYQKNCSVCHGTSGKGDGIAAIGLTVRPANHTSVMVQQQTDGCLFYKIANGRLPMPPFKNILTEKQRWSLVNYIRTLAKSKPEMVKTKNTIEGIATK